ncbi:MAG: guanylate kinase [Planctomycetota bacterium]|jgi:guanylate kinase
MADEGGAERLVDPGRVYVLSGPSGVGKNAIASRLSQRGGAARAVTATTRPPRAGEVDGRDYHFVDEEQFLRWIREGRLLEHTKYVDHYYGTPLASVNRAAAEGLPVLLTIDVDGALQMKRRWPEVTLIFVEPPSGEELQRRLRARRRDDTVDISQRLRRAREECEYADQYDFRVVNDDLEGAVQEVARIVAGRSQRQRQDS